MLIGYCQCGGRVWRRDYGAGVEFECDVVGCEVVKNDWLQEEMEDELLESKLSPQDLDDMWRLEQRVNKINMYTEQIDRIDHKRKPITVEGF